MTKKCSMSMKEYGKNMKHEKMLGEKKGEKMEMKKMHKEPKREKHHTEKEKLLDKSKHDKKAPYTTKSKGRAY